MDYATARSLIQTGDYIAVRDLHGIIGKLTAIVSPHTHAGVAKWVGDRVYMANLNSGRNHLTALSQLESFDVCDPPLGMPRALIEACVDEWLATLIEYGFPAFLVIGLKCLLRLKIFIHWRRVMVCSGGVVQMYEMTAALMLKLGLEPPVNWLEHSRMMSPTELVEELGVKFEVRPA